MTDEEGKITFEGLYQYQEGKEVTGRYTLKEIEPPKGYINSAEEISFTTSTVDGELVINIENEENLETIKEISIEGNTIKLILQDIPQFRLTKIDKETRRNY